MSSYPAGENPDPSTTSLETDFHQLCAILVAVKPNHPSKRRSDDVAVTLYPSFLPKGLVRYANAKDANRVAASYLDALAMILVSRQESQVFAVAAEVKSSALKLTVAENKDYHDMVAEHLMNVWRVLAHISNTTYPGPQQLEPDHVAKRSPKRMVSRDHHMKLASVIYKHSFKKLYNRLKKTVAVAREILLHIKEAHYPEELEVLGRIALTALQLHKIVQQQDGSSKINDEFVKRFRNFAILCNNFFTDPVTDTTPGLSPFNRLRGTHAESLKPLTGERLNYFEKKIRKSVDITNAIRTLMELATSKRMHHLFCKELDVETLQCEKDNYDLPRGDRWRTIFERNLDETVVNKEDLIKEKVLDEEIDKAKQEHDSLRNPRTCSTHCEATIVAHFVENSSSTPIPYIGVSKLSCQLCSEFLAANVSPSKRFYTRGCSGHWFFPWKLPNIFVGSGVDEKVRLALIRIFNSHMKNRTDLKRSGSTSSCGSGGSNIDDDFSEDEDERPLADLVAIGGYL